MMLVCLWTMCRLVSEGHSISWRVHIIVVRARDSAGDACAECVQTLPQLLHLTEDYHLQSLDRTVELS